MSANVKNWQPDSLRHDLMQSGSTINFLDKAIVSCASMLEEAQSWGFDIDTWRAHLNHITWPEILRQLAILWGLGPKRPKEKKELRPKMGTVGEDLVADESGGLRLRLPLRLGVGTMKAAAWQVLFLSWYSVLILLVCFCPHKLKRKVTRNDESWIHDSYSACQMRL